MQMHRSVIVFSLCLAALPGAAWCGGAWVPTPGNGDVQLGFSRKTASSSWDTQGDAFVNANNQGVISYHDFRYGYLSGEIGLLRRVSVRFLSTYLYGLEGPHVDEEKNVGLSDAWFGLKFALAQGSWPMALAATERPAQAAGHSRIEDEQPWGPVRRSARASDISRPSAARSRSMDQRDRYREGSTHHRCDDAALTPHRG